MSAQTILSESRFRQATALVQRATDLAAYESISQALGDPELPFPGAETALAIACRGERVSLNLTAAYIWESLDGVTAVAEIADRLSALCSISVERALQDVIHTLTDLVARRLVVSSGEEFPIQP